MADIVLHVGVEATDEVEALLDQHPEFLQIEEVDKHVGGEELALFITYSPQIVMSLTAMIAVIKGRGVRLEFKKGAALLEVGRDSSEGKSS